MEKKQRRKTGEPAAKTRRVPAISRNETAEFNPDYTYVIQNLKKIAILAVCFISFLVILSFIL